MIYYLSKIGLLTLALALVATVTFAAAESEEAAAAEKEMVLDPSTGEMVEAPRYGGTLRWSWKIGQEVKVYSRP